MRTFRNISIVITDHFLEESFGFFISSKANTLFLHNVHDDHALIIELILNFLLVFAQCWAELLVLWVLLDGTDGTNSSSLRPNEVFEANTEQISLVDGEIFTALEFNSFLKVLNHVLESLSLLSNSGQKDLLFHLNLVLV